jgi:hypothetical protein
MFVSRALTGKDADSVTGARRLDDGWSVLVDVVELQRIPASTSVLATYRVDTGETDAVRHLDVLTAVVAENAVLPLRFGTTAPDEQSVRDEVLAPAAPRLRDQLTTFADLVELRIDLTFDEETTLRAILADRADIRELVPAQPGSNWMEQQVRLGEAVAEALTGWIDEQGRAVMAPLTERARHAVRLPGPETQTDRWAFLVPRKDLAEMDGIVSSIRADNPSVNIEYVGPLPVLDFQAEELDAPATSPAESSWGW